VLVKILIGISTGIGLWGMAIIVWGVVLMSFRLIRIEISRLKGRRIFRERENLRHQLGTYLLLGLEFLIAADIIRTVAHPTLEEMAVLAGIVAIRTVISTFLDREILAWKKEAESCDATADLEG
jgi:uncharacterized membrane protein